MTILARLLPPRADAARPTPKAALSGLLAAALLALGLLAGVPATAGAVVKTMEGTKVGLQPRNLETIHEATIVGIKNEAAFYEPDPETFENPAGNPVLHGSNVFVIYWDPQHQYHPDWKNVIDTFFENVNAAEGANDVFAVDTQYTDKSNVPARNQLTFRGAYTDTRPYPSSKCVDPAPLESNPGTGMGPIACLTAQQMEFEVTSFIEGHGLTKGTENVYYLLTPPGVTTCLDEGGPNGHCSDFAASAKETKENDFKSESYENSFCSYHADVNPGGLESGDADTVLYAVVPWIAGGEGDGDFTPNDKHEAAFCQDGGFDPSSSPIEEYEEVPPLTKEEEEKLKNMNAKEKRQFERQRELKGPHEQEPNQTACPSQDGWCDTGLADLIINQVAVEQQNIVTDPLLGSWQDVAGNEATDECRNFFAKSLGGNSTASEQAGAGTLSNQQISGGNYYLNDAFNLSALELHGVPCIHGIILLPQFTATSPVNAGDKVAFDAGESFVTLSQNVSYNSSGEAKTHYANVTWNFGDGTPEVAGAAPGSPPCEEPWETPCAESVFHSYQYGGTYTVTLTVTDVGGNTATVSHVETVAGPPPPSPTPAGAGAGSAATPSNTGAGGSTGGGTPSGPPIPAPVATMAVVSHSLKRVLSRGLGVRYSVNEQVAGHFEVLLSSKLAKHLKISGALAQGLPASSEPEVVIGTALVVTLKGGKSTAHVMLSKSAVKRLRHMRALSAKLRLVVHNAATVTPASTTVTSAFQLGR